MGTWLFNENILTNINNKLIIEKILGTFSGNILMNLKYRLTNCYIWSFSDDLEYHIFFNLSFTISARALMSFHFNGSLKKVRCASPVSSTDYNQKIHFLLIGFGTTIIHNTLNTKVSIKFFNISSNHWKLF